MNVPSTSSGDERVTRRNLLTAVGTGATAALAGCASALGRGAPRSLNPADVVDDRPTARVWEFPRGATDANTPIQAYLEQAFRVPSDTQSADVRFRFGATVFDHSQYHHDRIDLRLRAPARLRGRPPADVFVEPLGGGFTSFRTYRRGPDTVVSLGDLETTGTIQFAFLVAPRARPTPETLGYEFEVTAEETGVFGRDVVASAAGRFPIVRGGG